jgi:hypothetical protein
VYQNWEAIIDGGSLSRTRFLEALAASDADLMTRTSCHPDLSKQKPVSAKFAVEGYVGSAASQSVSRANAR